MSAENDELTRLLKEYVNENKNQKTTLTATVKDNTDAFKEIAHKLELHELNDDNRHSQLETMFKSHSERIEKLEDRDENTGKHNLTKLEEELKLKKNQSFEWKKFLAQAVVTLGVAVFSGTVGFLVAALVKKN